MLMLMLLLMMMLMVSMMMQRLLRVPCQWKSTSGLRRQRGAGCYRR
jgi:hypothetical protein